MDETTQVVVGPVFDASLHLEMTLFPAQAALDRDGVALFPSQTALLSPYILSMQ
jgi:hypothetical protein